MDLVADMLWDQLQGRAPDEVRGRRIQPHMIRRFRRLPLLGHRRFARNADRLLSRFWHYPRLLRRQRDDFDCFHIADHSYAHLVQQLPADRTGVYCHDLDTFRCLLEPELEPRPFWFRAMTRRILRGMQQAAVVFCSTQATIDRIRKLGLVDATRLIYAPYGIAPEFTTDPPVEAGLQRATDMTGKLETCRHRLESPFLLHVGSCISRKRIDVLLEVFAAVRRRWPELDLIQVGGQWTAAQQRQIEQHRLAIRQLRGLDRKSLAALYRRAALVLLPSQAEGFGLPVIEALACGAVVVASDIPVLREVGEDGAIYCPVADISVWVETTDRLLTSPDLAPDRCTRISQARRFSWEKHAAIILEAYQKLASGVA